MTTDRIRARIALGPGCNYWQRADAKTRKWLAVFVPLWLPSDGALVGVTSTRLMFSKAGPPFSPVPRRVVADCWNRACQTPRATRPN